ncbi:Pentatricopeptide repeat-containing protein At1g12775, mitochondrial [Linum perenne]
MPLCSTSSISYSKLGIRRFSSVLFPKLASFSSSSSALQTFDFLEEETVNCSFEELQRRVRSHASSGDLRQALWAYNLMRCFNGKPSVHEFNALVHSYLRHGNPFSENLLQVYYGLRSSGIAANAITFNLLVNGLVAVGNFEFAFFILEEMFSSGFIPSFTVLSKFLKKSLEMRSLNDSIRVVDVMLMLDYIPTEPSFNRLICMLSRKGMIREAYLTFSAVLAKGCFFGVYTSNPILWALCKSGQSSTALMLCYWLKKMGVVLDVCSYTALVYGFCKEGLWEDACLCFDEMRENGLKASLVTYTVVVQFLCVNGRVEEALRYPSIMEAEGCSPDLLVYNVILQELSHLDRTSDVYMLLNVIASRGLCPDSYTIAVLAGGLLKAGKVGSAAGFLLDIISESHSVDVVVHNIYLQCLCSQHRTEEALSWLENGNGEGFTPSNVSYNIILNGFCRENKFNMALMLLSRFQHDVVSFNTILSWACKQKNAMMVDRILYHMEDKGIRHDVLTSTCLIRYLCRVGKVSGCLKLMDSMLLNGPKPTIATFNVALDELCKSGSLDMALQVFEKFRNSGYEPNATSYSILSLASNRKSVKFPPDSFVEEYG